MESSSNARGRGGPRGRGRVRSRGGAARGHQHHQVVEDSTAPAVERRGRGRRGGHAAARPRPVDELQLFNIDELPTGLPLEQPLHHKRRRIWCPPSQSAAARAPEVAAQESQSASVEAFPPSPAMYVDVSSTLPSLGSPGLPPSPAMYVDVSSTLPSLGSPGLPPSPAMYVDVSSTLPSLGSPGLPPSPAMYVECGPGTSRPSTSSSSRHRRLNEEEIMSHINDGSDPSSDDGDDDDEDMIDFRQPLTRAMQAILETPVDPVDPEEEVPAVQAVQVAVPAAQEAAVSIGETYSPRSLFQFEWKSFPTSSVSPELRRESFSNIDVGPTAIFSDPYDSFIAIWDHEIMGHMVTETNRYAQVLASQMADSNSLRPRSRICEWRDTTIDELYVFFAIILAMGVVVKQKISEYWNASNDLFVTPSFRALMSLRRFQLIGRCLHFANNEDMAGLRLGEGQNRLFKIQPILTHLNGKFQSLYNLQQNIALDESLLQWKGWLNINQLIPNKKAKIGIKSYEICESKTGYLWRFQIHAHQSQGLRSDPEDPMSAIIPSIVLNLIQGLEHKGHTLWMDNYYNSPALARTLKSIGFDCVGTLRTNRQFVPETLTNLTKRNMRPGQITGFTSGDVDLMVWRDQNRVATISTYHGNAVSFVNGSSKPILISDYNVMMGGVDKKDQMLSMYPIERKRTKIWYKKLFRRLLNVSVLNAYILTRHTDSKWTHRNFRLSINSIACFWYYSAQSLR